MSRTCFPLRNCVLVVAASAACALSAVPAIAADAVPAAGTKAPAKPPAKAAVVPAREGSLGKGKASGPLLTREQLRQCMAEQDRLKQEATSLVQAQAEFGKTRAEIDRQGAEIAAELATLDRTSQAAVDAYNAKLRDRAKLSEGYQAAAPAFNERVDKLDADKQAFTKDCADRRYLDDDFDAVKGGK